MSRETLRRHHRRALDHAVSAAHRGWAELEARAAFVELLAAARGRSDLLVHAPVATPDGWRFEALDALVHLARWWREQRAPIATWAGAHGHPRVVLSALAAHLFALYPTPRFLTAVWWDRGDDGDAWRAHAIAIGRGASVRTLPLPLPLTRAMAHHFLATADHVPVRPALRWAEVSGLGGEPGLGLAIAMSRLGTDFTDPGYWRPALAWLARWSHEVPPDRLGPILDYFEAMRAAAPRPPVAGSTPASLWRRVTAWHVALGQAASGDVEWAATGWPPLRVREPVAGDRAVCWDLVELCDAAALAVEGQRMRHCVAMYRWWCQRGQASIWTLRRRVDVGEQLGAPRSVATIEVDPRTRRIVQVRGPANHRPVRAGVALVRQWAAAAGLGWDPAVTAFLAEAPVAA